MMLERLRNAYVNWGMPVDLYESLVERALRGEHFDLGHEMEIRAQRVRIEKIAAGECICEESCGKVYFGEVCPVHREEARGGERPPLRVS
jgi:hypothetical protein